MTKIFKKTCKKNIKKRGNTIKNTNKKKSGKKQQYGGAGPAGAAFGRSMKVVKDLLPIKTAFETAIKNAKEEFGKRTVETGSEKSAIIAYGTMIAAKAVREVMAGSVINMSSKTKMTVATLSPFVADFIKDYIKEGIKESINTEELKEIVNNIIIEQSKILKENFNPVTENNLRRAFNKSKSLKYGPGSRFN